MSPGFRIERVRSHPSPDVWLVQLGPMPLPEENRPALAAFLTRFARAVSGRYNLTETVWIEATHIHHEGATRLLAPNARTWMPKTGFGIHPDAEAPRMWTKDDFSGAEYGVHPPIFNNQVFEVSAQAGHASAIGQMAGRGVLMLALLSGASADFKQETRRVLGPMVKERAFHAYEFFFPLLSASSAESPHIAEWMGNASVYLREIFNDQHLLVLATVPLEPCLQALGAESVGQNVWFIEQASLRDE